jgi:hypothetical protein
LPLYVFCGDHVLCARLREANHDASFGSLAEIQRIVGQIRTAWPEVRIVLRGDSGFCRNELMSWCENHGVDFVFGLARNQRLRKIIGAAMHEATGQRTKTGKPARVFAEFDYKTKKTKTGGWDRERLSVAAKKGAKMAAPGVPVPYWAFPSYRRTCSERPGAVKGAPLLGAAKRTLDGEDRSGMIEQEGKGKAKVVRHFGPFARRL